jgi:GH15 family glucan-1,4-alpha-glucosidase
MALPIAEYAVIGDRRTAALVGTNGSIDWACLPRFDSPACFAALLGSEEHGHWQLVPEEQFSVTRRYVDDTTVLETTFTTSGGVLVLTDAMPSGDDHVDILRILRCTAGRVRVRHEWRIRLDYGHVRPWVRRRTVAGEEVITAVGGPDQLMLRGPMLPTATGRAHVDDLEMTAGDELTFQMTWLPSHVEPDGLGDTGSKLDAAMRADQEWAEICPADVPHADVVRRSLLTLRLMTHEVTGGIVAAPTTSLPEDLGGVRNWDYRYTWLRDAALTLTALVQAGHTEEAGLWRSWLLRTIAGEPAELQIMYGVGGERRLVEQELGHLPGYAGSRPVRIGNAAFQQRQLDVVGETLDALGMIRDSTLGPDDDAWALQQTLLEDLAERWRDRDQGIWEIRGEPQHFTHSRVMVWVAFDRGVRAIEQHGLDGPLEHWRSLREQVREEILTRGFDSARNTFTQHYETAEVDASLLVLPIVGFVAGDDPRMLGTLEAIERDLMRDGLPLRYRTETGVDGLSGDEHPFLACAFWLVSAYSLAGRTGDAHALFDRLVGLTNDVGLLSEEYDASSGRMIGNFPQALSHLSLVQAALHLAGRHPPDQ